MVSKNILQGVERSILSTTAMYASTPHTHLQRWLHGKQQTDTSIWLEPGMSKTKLS